MTIFYDPQKRQPQIWVIPVFVLAVIALIIGLWVYGQNQKSKPGHQEQQADIFAK